MNIHEGSFGWESGSFVTLGKSEVNNGAATEEADKLLVDSLNGKYRGRFDLPAEQSPYHFVSQAWLDVVHKLATGEIEFVKVSDD